MRAAVLLLAFTVVHLAPRKAHAVDIQVQGDAGLSIGLSELSAGFHLGGGVAIMKPVLDLFFVQPAVYAEVEVGGSTRAIGLLRCNFPLGDSGVLLSAAVGTGWGLKAAEGEMANPTGRTFHAVEFGFQLGGRRHRRTDIAIYFDHSDDDGATVIWRFSLGFEAP